MNILITKPQADYRLLDAGDGEKLEQYGKMILRRPDPQALWKKNPSAADWDRADAFFSRDEKNASWNFKSGVPKDWVINFGGLKFKIKPTAFKHTGLFPEQLSNWDWLRQIIKSANREINVLNLFGYTGGATLACSAAGAKVCHVDGSKSAIAWAKENAALSNLSDKPIRWIIDDARAFVRREIKRGVRYDGIILDPPAFGHGPNKELWKIEDHFIELLDSLRQVLSDKPLFILINGYASGYSSIAYENCLLEFQKTLGGKIDKGELTIEATDGKLLPCGIYSRLELRG